MLEESESENEAVVRLISKFCSMWTCKDCLKKKRRHPENPKKFIRICVDCENLFLRKTLFEEFWNQKTRKEKEIEIKRNQKSKIMSKINSRMAKNMRNRKKQSDLQMANEMIGEINQKILKTENDLRRAEQREKRMVDDQLEMTNQILKSNDVLNERENTVKQMKTQLKYFKSHEIKNMHKNQDLKLNVNFFLDRILDKNGVDRKNLVGGLESSGQSKMNSDRGGTFKGFLSPEKKRSLRKNQKKHEKKMKNQKLNETKNGFKLCNCLWY